MNTTIVLKDGSKIENVAKFSTNKDGDLSYTLKDGTKGKLKQAEWDSTEVNG